MGDDLAQARGRTGGPPGSSLSCWTSRCSTRDRVERALLLFDRAMFASSHPNPFFASATVRAINDWNADRWLAADDRLFGTALIPEQVPEKAVAEL